MTHEFKKFPKIYRTDTAYFKITEKMDGTNSCVVFNEDGSWFCQSRNRILSEEEDNHGFWRACCDNLEELKEKLGLGRHYGEWVGPKINRNRHDFDHGKFYLFDTDVFREGRRPIPDMCEYLPILSEGTLDEFPDLNKTMTLLLAARSLDYSPEGIVVTIRDSKRNEDIVFKKTYKNPEGKWKANESSN